MKRANWNETPLAAAVRGQVQEMEEDLYHAFAASDEDDGEDEGDEGDGEGKGSLSETASNFVKALRTVSLEPSRNAEFESFFFPKAGRDFMLPVLESLADVTSNVNMFFRFMRACMFYANTLSSYNEEQRERLISEIFVKIFEGKRESKSILTEVDNFVRASRRPETDFHTILRSKRYPGGLDIVMMGDGEDPAEGLPAPFFGKEDANTNPEHKLREGGKDNYFVNDSRRGRWQSPVGLAILEAAKEINVFLFGTTAVSERLIHRGIPIDTKFTDIEAIWLKHTGIKLPSGGDIVTDMVLANPLAEQFLQIEVLKQPSRKVQELARETRKAATNDAAGAHTINGRINELINDPEHIALEAELLNVTLRTAIRYTLEADIAHFVTQSAESETVSLSRANAWFSVYISQVMRAKKTKITYDLHNTAAIKIENIPRYTTSASTLKKIPALRAQNGFSVEKTKGNADGMFIQSNGTLSVRPDAETLTKSKLSEEHERISDEFLDIIARNEMTVAAYMRSPYAAFWPHVDPQELERLEKLRAQIEGFNGCTLGYDWDFGLNAVAGKTAGAVTTTHQVGAVSTDSLAIADWLGYNMAKEGERPVKRTFAQAMFTINRPDHTMAAYAQAEMVYGSLGEATKFTNAPVFVGLQRAYMRVAYGDKIVPQLPELLAAAMRNLGYTKLPTEGHDALTRYKTFLNEDGTVIERFSHEPQSVINSLFFAAVDAASGKQGTFIWKETYDSLKTADTVPTSIEVEDELENHPNYFRASSSTTADFAKLFTYFGGQVYKQMLDAINSVPQEHWLDAKGADVNLDFGPWPDQEGSRHIVPQLHPQTNTQIFRDVLPFSLMLGKYAPNSETIFAEAEAQVKSIQPDESFSADDIKVPGLETKDARAIFPHQEDIQRYLRKENPPSFAIIAVAPGGGKTGQGVIDITCLMQDMAAAGGAKVVPLIICPNGLVPTWCDEMKYFLGSNWNPFPITAGTLKRWGEKRLMEAALAAPPNTIFITSMTFIGGRTVKVSVGSTQIRLSQNLEMIRRIAPTYVAIDESHNLKNFTSARHRAVKALTTSTTVKWLRLLTGTIMPDRAKDIEGQIALKAPHVFRAGDIANINPNADAQESVVKAGDRVIGTFTPLNGKRAVDKLSNYISFIVKNKKDWAYMLPSAIESFHPVPMVDFDGVDGTTPAEIEQQRLHEELYKLVLKQTTEQIANLMIQKEKAEKAANKELDREVDRDSEDDGPAGDNKFEDNDEDFAGEHLSQKMWEKHLARFERLIIAPQYDPAFEEVFGDMGEGFVSRKASYIANLVHKHFNPDQWKRNKQYVELDLVEHNGQLYVARKYTDGEIRVKLPDSQIGLPPDENSEYWKAEPRGKLIIITRFNHSASAVYDALPPNYKDQAVKFTGDEPDKVKMFNQFKTDDKIQILIANEQGMSEGHNLQLASRMIRAEAPWGPGALNQTAARVWRPDAKGAIEAAKGTGGLTRDVVFLDWVLADNTMEVAKLARVISKTFGIARITEAANPLYQDLLNNAEVLTEKEDRRLSLSIEMLATTAGLRDEPFGDMVTNYKALNSVEAKEFAEMRAKNKAEMLVIEAAPNVAGAKEMEMRPFVPNMQVNDPHNWGLVNVEVLLRDKEFAADHVARMRTKPALTEWGTGKIVGFRLKKKGSKEISSIVVNLKNPPAGMDSRQNIPVSMCYMATNPVSPEHEAKYFDVSTDATNTEEERNNKRNIRLEKQRKAQEELEEKERKIREAQEKKDVSIIKKEKADGDKREENEKKGKPLNDGIYDTGGVIKIGGGKKLKPTDDPNMGVMQEEVEDEELEYEDEEVASISLHPAYYHGFATLEAMMETEQEVSLKEFGFKHTPAYAYITVNNKKKFHTIYEWFYDNFEVDTRFNTLFEKLNSAFETGTKNTHKLWYSLELAPVSELPAFFAVQKRMSSNRKAVRVFPIFTEEHVMLCVDIRTNPAIVKHIGKAIPGGGVKWQRSDGEWMYFGKNKTDLRSKINEVARNVTVSNKEQAIKELTEINFKYKTR
ncbi:DNA helicase [Pseudomonas phage Lu11]|uniref:DNA helicase n=1 Tax=Pseudomonas phage Lu11 TaxID=1161927 RepID=UPI00025F153E|nr:DNA helicase [Pseudomonas phage Lu11]AFH14631.1 hypothetical protein Lu11_0099 [Pseudomonas phage Lu11]